MDRETLGDYVNERSDIVKTVSAFLDVHKKGSSYVAVCPFHNDTNPSLSISPTRNIFKCFVCGVGGNSITFVMKYAHLSYFEAVQKVAQIDGIVIPKELATPLVKREKEVLDPSQKALNDLLAFYQVMLRSPQGDKAREYLKGRQIDDDVINHFGIGYAPKDPTLAIRALRERKGYDVETLEKAGIIASGSSSLRDRYSERIMFPLRDENGNPVGFSGRKYLPDDPSDSKYVNSPETPLFHKSELLYNLDNARLTMRKDNYLYVVEGFMDVIALYRAGMNSAVALMGTSLTKEHLAFLKKAGVEIRVSLDSDDPGQNATKVLAPHLTQAGIVYRITRRFPPAEGKDADEILDREGKEALLKRMGDLLNPLEYSLSFVSKELPDLLPRLDAIIDTERNDFFRLSPSEKEKVVLSIAKLGDLPTDFVYRRFGKEEPQKNTIPIPLYSAPTLADNSKEAVYAQLKSLAIGQEIANKLKDRLLPGLINIEAQLLAKLPLSPRACQDYEAQNGLGQQRLATPVFRAIGGYILAFYSDHKMGTYGLDIKDLNGPVLAKIQSDLNTAPNPDLDGVTDSQLTNFMDLLSRQKFLDFDEEDFQRILIRHQAWLDRQRVKAAKNLTQGGSDEKELKEIESLAKKTTRFRVGKKQ